MNRQSFTTPAPGLPIRKIMPGCSPAAPDSSGPVASQINAGRDSLFEAINRLARKVDTITEDLAELERAIDPILRPRYPRPPEDGNPTDDPTCEESHVAVAMWFESAARQIHVIAAKIEDIRQASVQDMVGRVEVHAE